MSNNLSRATVGLPVVLSLLAFVASLGVSIGIAYATFTTYADVEARIDKAMIRVTHPITPNDMSRLTADIREIKGDMKMMKTDIGNIKTDVAVLKTEAGGKKGK